MMQHQKIEFFFFLNHPFLGGKTYHEDFQKFTSDIKLNNMKGLVCISCWDSTFLNVIRSFKCCQSLSFMIIRFYSWCSICANGEMHYLSHFFLPSQTLAKLLKHKWLLKMLSPILPYLWEHVHEAHIEWTFNWFYHGTRLCWSLLKVGPQEVGRESRCNS